MIAPAAFQAALAPLKAFREGQGYTVRLVDIEDVYDEFSFGSGKRRRPSRISSSARPASGAARHASCSSSGTRPRIRATTSASESRTTCRRRSSRPARWKRPRTTGSSMPMTTVLRTWRSWADSRPVPTPRSRRWCRRSSATSRAAGGDWQRSVLLVSDRDPTDGVDFAALNDRARELVPDTYQVTHIRRGIDPDAGAAGESTVERGSGARQLRRTRLGGVVGIGPAHHRRCARG